MVLSNFKHFIIGLFSNAVRYRLCFTDKKTDIHTVYANYPIPHRWFGGYLFFACPAIICHYSGHHTLICLWNAFSQLSVYILLKWGWLHFMVCVWLTRLFILTILWVQHGHMALARSVRLSSCIFLDMLGKIISLSYNCLGKISVANCDADMKENIDIWKIGIFLVPLL